MTTAHSSFGKHRRLEHDLSCFGSATGTVSVYFDQISIAQGVLELKLKALRLDRMVCLPHSHGHPRQWNVEKSRIQEPQSVSTA